MITIGSLFAGIGGLELGIEQGLADVGIESRVAWQCEQSAYCRRVLRKHWPDAQQYEDVREMRGEGIERVDILCGGFPCQDISAAGPGEGLEGARSGLFYELARLVRELRPRVVFAENVAVIVAYGRGGAEVLGEFARLGLDAVWSTVSVADVGGPHLRRRWFCVAWRPVPDTDGVGAHQQHKPRAGRRTVVADRDGAQRALADTEVKRRPARGQPERTPAQLASARSGDRDGLGDADRPRLEVLEHEQLLEQPAAERAGRRASRGPAESRMGRGLDGLPGRLDGGLIRWPAGRGEPQHDWEPPRIVAPRSVKNRPARVKACGNAVSPPVARLVTRAHVVPALIMAGVLHA